MTYVTVDDVAVELGRTIEGAEVAQIDAWISRVEGRIAARITDLSIRVAEAAYLSQLVGVVVAVVARKVRNPEGMRSERIDDFYYDRGAQPSADLWPTADEWAELLPEASAGAFSTRPSFEPDTVALPW